VVEAKRAAFGRKVNTSLEETFLTRLHLHQENRDDGNPGKLRGKIFILASSDKTSFSGKTAPRIGDVDLDFPHLPGIHAGILPLELRLQF